MQLRLRTKLTLVMTSLVLLVAAVLSGVFAAQLLEQLLEATNTRADDLGKQVFVQAKHALLEAGQQGLRPASDAPDENLAGLYLPRRTPLSQLVQRNFLHQVKVLAGPTKVFELDFPFSNANL